ncbi:hypothetical protein L7F22_045088 [Adiantum nelumboides]|nr:hypothetical protein [Adiantum nelumboides]
MVVKQEELETLEKVELGPIAVIANGPFEKWGIDAMEPLPRTANGKLYILVAIDYMTRFGTPLEIVSDNGPGFRRGLLTEVCEALLEKANGIIAGIIRKMVEKANGIIAGIIRKMVESKPKRWDNFLDGAIWAYRTTYRDATQFTPFHLVYGQEALQPIELNIPTIKLTGRQEQNNDEAWIDRLLNLVELEWKREAAYHCYEKKALQLKDKLNEGIKDKQIKEKSLVLRYNNALDNRFDAKFERRWEGPFIVKKAFTGGYYQLMDLNGKEHPRKVNGYRLKPYLSRILPAVFETKQVSKKTKKVVKYIEYTSRGAIVKTEDGTVYITKYVILTVSLGVLQSNLITYKPDLPFWKLETIFTFNMAVYTKIFLKFPYTFWPVGPGTEFFVYADNKRGYYNIWQHLENEYPGSNILFVTATDDESRRIEQQSDEETKQEIMVVLRKIFGPNIPEIEDILVPRWWKNRFFAGTFTNWPIGASEADFDRMKSSIFVKAPLGRLYFAGEHTDEKFNGYVHGAYFSGIATANSMIDCFKHKKCDLITSNALPWEHQKGKPLHNSNLTKTCKGACCSARQEVVPDEDAYGTEVADRDRLAHIVHVSSAFGSLMSDLLVSRPDLAYAIGAFAVGVVSRAMTDTGIVHSGAMQVIT